MSYYLPRPISSYYLSYLSTRPLPWQASTYPDPEAEQEEVFVGEWQAAQQEASRRNHMETRWAPGEVRELERGLRAMDELDF
jgi:hypothetical protein